MDLNKKKEIMEKAQIILSKIRSGEDFNTLMVANSEDPGIKSNPKGYTFTRGKMVKEFEDAAFSLNVGEVSSLVETNYGYHIIKLEEKVPVKQLTLDEVKDSIKTSLEPVEKQAYLDNLVKQWKADSNIVNKVR